MHISHYPYHIYVNERLKIMKRLLLDCVLFSLFSCDFLQGRKPILFIDYMHDVSAVKPNSGSGQRAPVVKILARLSNVTMHIKEEHCSFSRVTPSCILYLV